MIKLLCSGSRPHAGAIVASALRRSCSSQLVSEVSFHHLEAAYGVGEPVCWVLIDPLEAWAKVVIKALETWNCKVVIFGALPPTLARHLGAESKPLTQELVDASSCVPASSKQYTQSAACVRYVNAVGGRKSPISERPFLRYDFTDEWNNLGYGAIRGDASIWSLAQLISLPERQCIADVVIGNHTVSAYAALWDRSLSSALWFNRAVGPVDSHEWSLVEHFIANYRCFELPCWPVLREAPFGFDAAVTMRLDCDEDIESARSIWRAYLELDVPFSLALHTTVLADPVNHILPREVLANGGALLSHTATHAPNWGGSYDAAYQEGGASAARILAVTGHSVRYAVSPFHQTPIYARAGLADAGYAGCIGGIIRNDPDFLIARAGHVVGTGQGFIGHSQQCMLHGDCVLEGSDPQSIFKLAFDIAKSANAFFGYLDHPFSPRYQYGWPTEDERIEFHRLFIAYIRRSGNVLFCNENDAMDFLWNRAALSIGMDGNKFVLLPSGAATHWSIGAEYRGQLVEVPVGGATL